MSRDASVTLDWADDAHHFRLAWGELVKLQEACDAGPYVVLNRLLDGSWRMEDVTDVIRLGLIGGGMTPADALRKVRAYVQDRPPLESVPVAQVVLSAALIGAPEEDQPGNGEAADRGSVSMTSRTESSGSPPSTEQEPS